MINQTRLTSSPATSWPTAGELPETFGYTLQVG